MTKLARASFRERIERAEEARLSPLATPLVPGPPAARGARLRSPHAVPARPRPDRALEGVPAAQAQDAGVHRARGRPLPHPAHPHARDVRDRAHGGARARPQRGPDRGDRAGARPRPPAVRPRRRGGARRAACASAGATRFRHNEHSLRMVDEIERPQPHRAGARRHPPPHGARAAGDAGGPDRARWWTGSPTSTTTSTTRSAPACCASSELPRAEIELLGATGSERIETLVVDLLDRSEEAGDIVQGEEVGGAMLRLREFMFEQRLPGPEAQLQKPRIERMLRSAVRPLRRATRRPPLIPGASDEQRVVDWLAGMTDRFAIRAFSDLSLPAGVLTMALFTRDSIDRLRDAVDMVDLVGTQDRPAPRGVALDRAVPVPRRAHAVVLGQRRGEALLLLRLPGQGRRLRLRRADRGARLPRGGRAAGGPLRGASSSARTRIPRPSSGARRKERLMKLLDRDRRLLRDATCGSRRRRRGRATTCAGAACGEEVLREFRVGYAPSAWDRVIVGAQRDGFAPARAGGRRAGPARPRGRAVRPLPRPDHVPAGRRPRARARLRGARDGARAGARSTSTPRRTSSTTRVASCSASTARARRRQRAVGSW